MADINTYGSIASILGLIVSGLAFWAADGAHKAVKRVQDSFLFDKRIPQHLKYLNDKLSNLNGLLADIETNKNHITTLLSQVKSELQSLSEKTLNEKVLLKIKDTIKSIDKVKNDKIYKESDQTFLTNRISHFFKSFYLTSHKDIWTIYNDLNEIYTQIDNLKLDKNCLFDSHNPNFLSCSKGG